MENTVKERLIKFIKYKKISIREFERRVGVSNGYMKALKKSPTTDKMLNIIRIFPDLNKDWLLTGEGEMLTETSTPNLSLLSNAVPSRENAIDIEPAGENKNGGVFYRDKNTGQLYIEVPHMPYAARGEFPNLADSLEPNSEWGTEIYKVDKKVNGRYISFDVRGDSMDNGMRKCLQDGDKVLVRELELDNWRTLRTGDHRMWVLVFGTSVLIKELSDFNPTTGEITCHSLNPSPEYHDFTLSLDDVRHLYYVIRIKPHDIIGI